MSSNSESQEPLQERLKDQVSVSIKEALDKANTVLTNLHRVQSYLDVIRILSTHRSGDVIKNALEQIHAARNDTATLLQHIYLTEIGLQSLQDFGNGGGLIGASSATTTTSTSSSSTSVSALGSLMPILGAASITSSAVAVIDGVHDSMMEGLGSQDLDFTTTTATSAGAAAGGASVEENEGQPPTKKMKPGGVMVSTCVSCNRKFAAPYSASNTHLCRNCRSGVAAASVVAAASSPTATKSPTALKFSSATNSSLQKSPLTSTPKVTKSGGGKQGSGGIGSGRNLVPMRCKICNTCFRYRRCLFRHLRENHPGIDQDNLMQYIDMTATSNTDGQQNTTSPTIKGDTSLSGGKGVPQQRQRQQDANDSTSSSLHVTIGSEVGGMSEAGDSMLVGEGTTPGNENGVLLVSEGRLEAPHSEPSSDDDDDDDDDEGEPADTLADTEPPQPVAPEDVTDKGTSSTPGKVSGKYNCTVCTKSFDRPYRLQRHLQIHNPNRPRVQCQFCDRSFTRIDTLENHVKSLHSNERPFKCTFEGCSKSFPLNSALVHHLKTHMGGKPYQCGECDLSFALFGEFKVHVNEAHVFTKDRRCADCFKLFSTSEELDQHYAQEHRYECEICGKSFARLGYLQAHIEIHNGVSMYNCRQCDAGFDSEYSYKQHIKAHPNYNKAKRAYPCQICGKTFYDSRKMIMHSHTDEHQEKAKSLGLPAGVVLQNLSETEDVPTDMSVLVNEVANSIQASGATATPSVDDNLIQSIVESEAFKAAAASVGVSTATTTGTSMNTSSNSSSEGSSSSAASSLLNSGGTVVSEAATLLQSPSGVAVAVASAEQ